MARITARLYASASPGTTHPEDVERDLRCTLDAHALGDHHAFVLEVPGRDTGAVWTRWTRGHAPAVVLVLPDCPAAEPCCEFAGHPGAHTWQFLPAPFTPTGGQPPARRRVGDDPGVPPQECASRSGTGYG
ncbi:hypothetical protein [Streptomyces sp. NRRL F-5123]|uniref:hypothetical protein n=1 Tax=Streptomyces sp. NRRL F-5123 TaxID=1463856 RepID=UPI000694BF43|nr:hypothetical protein [Streptomyces sp. NRRL F-5123]